METSSINLLENLTDNLETQSSVNCISAEVGVTETIMTANVNQNQYKLQINVKHPFEDAILALANTETNTSCINKETAEQCTLLAVNNERSLRVRTANGFTTTNK